MSLFICALEDEPSGNLYSLDLSRMKSVAVVTHGDNVLSVNKVTPDTASFLT